MGWLSETGRVVAVEPDAVWIEADRSAACGKCAARAGCGQGALSALLHSGKGRVRATSGETLAAAGAPHVAAAVNRCCQEELAQR